MRDRVEGPGPTEPGRGAPPSPESGGRIDYKWLATAVVIVGGFMVILDQTVVNVALPALESDFQTSLTSIQWVVTGYALALAAVIPLSGWMSDRFGTKRIFLVSQIAFVGGSVLCGLAWSEQALIIFRVVQGLGGGLVMPVGMTILMRVTKPEERGRMMSMLGVPMMIAPVLGPTLGGWLVQAESWRLIFYINVPIGILGALLSAFALRPDRQSGPLHPLDVGGLALVSPAVVGIVYGLSQPDSYGWGSWRTLVPLFGGFAILVLFVLYELRQANPLIDIRVFKDAAFNAAMGVSFLVPLTLFGSVFLMPLFLQQVQGYSTLNAGIILSSQGLAAAATMPIGGILTDRIGARRIVPVGVLVLTASSIWMTLISPSTSSWEVGFMLASRGIGMGLTMMPAMSAAYVTLPPAHIARATSIANVVQRVAGAFGVAILATVLSNRITANLPPLPGGLSGASGNGLAAAPLPVPVKTVLLEQVAKGFDETFWVAAGLTILCLPMGLLLRRALTAQEVRSYALRQAGEGVLLGVAAQRVRSGKLNGNNGFHSKLDKQAAFETLARPAIQRLEKATTLLRAGTGAAGMVPQAGLSRGRKVAFVVAAIFALVAMVLLFWRGYQTSAVPSLPPGVFHR